MTHSHGKKEKYKNKKGGAHDIMILQETQIHDLLTKSRNQFNTNHNNNISGITRRHAHAR
jgi:hypothetical protein